ncbi:MAG: hypothetical protein WA705_01480 [Candidatus Ozemobacteraceae bacterium]
MMNTRIGKICFFAICAFFLTTGSAWAIPYHTGPFTVEIEVRNSIQMPIPNCRVSCTRSGREIRVKASAAGYLSTIIRISADNGNYYQRDITLGDPKKRFKAYSWDDESLSSVYFQTDQYGFAPDTYGITACIPVEIWPNPSIKGILLTDDLNGFPLRFEGSIDQIEGFHRVKIVIPRRFLDATGRNFQVYFDTRKPVSPHAAVSWLNRVKKSEMNNGTVSSEDPEEVSQRLGNRIDRSLLREARDQGSLPTSFLSLLVAYERFDALHHDRE